MEESVNENLDELEPVAIANGRVYFADGSSGPADMFAA